MHFKIDWASLIVGSKFTVFALFYFVFEGNFVLPVWGAYIWRSLYMEGLIIGILRYVTQAANLDIKQLLRQSPELLVGKNANKSYSA